MFSADGVEVAPSTSKIGDLENPQEKQLLTPREVSPLTSEIESLPRKHEKEVVSENGKKNHKTRAVTSQAEAAVGNFCKHYCRHMTLSLRPQPHGPSSLLYLQVRVRDRICWALLDCGAADNFVATQIVKKMNLTPLKVCMPLAVSVGNGEIIYSDQYVSENLNLGNYRAWTHLKMLENPIHMVSSIPFLLKHQPGVDWKPRTIEFPIRGKEYSVRGMPGTFTIEMLSRVTAVQQVVESYSSITSSVAGTLTENGSATVVPQLLTQRKDEVE